MFVLIALLHGVPIVATALITRSPAKTRVSAVICALIGLLGGPAYLPLDLLVVIAAYSWSRSLFRAAAPAPTAPPSSSERIPASTHFRDPGAVDSMRDFLSVAALVYLLLAFLFPAVPALWN